MADFAEHYNTVILPTRAYKPKDKALVENAVNILYSRVYALTSSQFQEHSKVENSAVLIMRLSPGTCSALTIGTLTAMSFEIRSYHLTIGGRQKRRSPIEIIYMF